MTINTAPWPEDRKMRIVETKIKLSLFLESFFNLFAIFTLYTENFTFKPF